MRPVIFVRPIALPQLPHFVPLWQRHIEHPKFIPGDTPTRCFLVPFWMKMLYPGSKNPRDHVVFKVHPQMTRFDIQQYLEKIYNVPVLSIRVKMLYHDLEPNDQPAAMVLRRSANPFFYPPKPERYEKIAYVRLAPGVTFEFPDIFKSKRPSDIVTKLQEESSEAMAPAQDADRDVEVPAAESPVVADAKGKKKPVAGGLSRLPAWFTR